MRNGLKTALLVFLVLCVSSAAIAFGAVSPEFNAPFYAAAVLVGICWAARLLVVDKASWLKSPMHVPVLAFAVYATAWYVASPVEYDSRLELLQVGLYTLIYFAVTTVCYAPQDRKIVLATLMALAIGESIYGLWQFTARADAVLLLQRPTQYHGRASGTFVCPNHLAGFLEIVIGMLLARLTLSRSEVSTLQETALRKLLQGYVMLFALAGLVTTFSRGGWLALIVGVIVFFLWGDWRASVLSARTIAAGIVILLLAILGIVSIKAPLLLPSLSRRIGEIFVIQTDGTPAALHPGVLDGRELMWRPTISMIHDQPVFGTGPGSWQWMHLKYRNPGFQMRPDYTHSDLLQLASDYGVVGFVLVAGIFGCFFWHAARMSKATNTADQRSFSIGSAVAVAAILTHSLYDFNMHIPANALLLVTIMGLTVAMDNGEDQRRRIVMGTAARLSLGVLVLLLASWCAWVGGTTVLSQRYAAQATDAKEVLDWDRALRLYQRAISVDPKYPEPYAKMGDIYRVHAALRADPAGHAERLRLVQSAIDAYRQSLALSPFDSQVMLRLAAAYELAQAKDKALDTYEQALTVDPNDAFAYMRLGIFLRHIGANAQAAKAFEKSWQLSQEDRTALLNLEEIRPKR